VFTVYITWIQIRKFYVLPTVPRCVFCMDLRTNSDYLPTQHYTAGFHNRGGLCLQRGTSRILKYVSGSSYSVSLRSAN